MLDELKDGTPNMSWEQIEQLRHELGLLSDGKSHIICMLIDWIDSMKSFIHEAIDSCPNEPIEPDESTFKHTITYEMAVEQYEYEMKLWEASKKAQSFLDSLESVTRVKG